MTKPPENMTRIWVRDDEGNLQQRIKAAAKRDRRLVADYLRLIIDAAIANDTTFVVHRGVNSDQDGSQK